MSGAAPEVLRIREDDRPRGPVMFAAPSEFRGSDEWVVRAVSLREIGGFETALSARVVKWYFGSGQLAEPVRTRQDDPRKHREDLSSEREVNLYREELRRLRSEQRVGGRQRQEHARESSAYLDEAIALAHPIAFRLLGCLSYHGETELQRVFELFDASSSTFEGIARLHLVGAVRFDDGKLVITSLRTEILRAFGLPIAGE
jgi:hypothetical protein